MSEIIFGAVALYLAYLLLPFTTFFQFGVEENTYVIKCNNRLQAGVVYWGCKLRYIACTPCEPPTDISACLNWTGKKEGE